MSFGNGSVFDLKVAKNRPGQFSGYFDPKSKVEPKALAIKPGLLGLVRAHQKLIQTTSDKFYLKGSAKSVKFLSFLKYNKELSLGSGQGSDKLKSSFFSLPQVTSTYRNWFGDCTVSSKF